MLKLYDYMQNYHNSEFSKQTMILKITGHVTLNFPVPRSMP